MIALLYFYISRNDALFEGAWGRVVWWAGATTAWLCVTAGIIALWAGWDRMGWRERRRLMWAVFWI